MTHEDFEIKLTEAEEQSKQGKYDEAERLCKEVLGALESYVKGSFQDVTNEKPLDKGQIEDYAKHNVLLEQNEWDSLRASAARTLGVIAFQRSNYTIALEHFTAALNISQVAHDRGGIAKALGSIGNVHGSLSDYARALDYFGKALALHEELGNKAGEAASLSNIGIVYNYLSDYARALEYYGKALALAEELGNKAGVATHLGNIGIVHTNLSDYARALEYFGKALVLEEELGNKAGLAVKLGNIGNVHYYLSDYALALKYYDKALALEEELGNKAEVAINLGNIGAAYATPEFDGYDTCKAEEYFLKAVAMNDELGTKRQNVYVFKGLSELYATSERWKESRECFEKYHDVDKEVQSEEATKQANLMEQQRQIAIAKAAADARHQTTMSILHKTLPPVIADRLIAGEKDIADRFESVSILFADIVGFTPLAAQLSPREVVQILNNLFSRFDKLTEKYGVERIKTIGDAYMIVAGAPEVVADHALRLAQTAFGMLEETADFNAKSGYSIALRIGVSSGEAIAAVVGDVKFSYDLWSDAVNTASRMESHGEAGKIHCTEEFVRALSLSSFQSFQSLKFVERGEMHIKGKGIMKTYYLEQSK